MGAHAVAIVEAIDPIHERIQAGDHREAITLCARTHAGTVGRLCMAMLGSQAEAEEALQDTLVAAHGAMASYRGEGTVRAWLYGIARRVCARRLETRAVHDRKLRLVEQTGGGAVAVEGADAQLDRARRGQRVREALARVTPTEREALLLRYEGDLSFREIGLACGIDEATARKRTSRGLDRLRRLLAGEST